MQNKTLKITAIVSAICLVVIAGFCVLVALLMYGCGKAMEEGVRQGEADAEKFKAQIEQDQQQLQRKLNDFRDKVAPSASPEWK